jgi:YVTN family beta-propeller protein
MRQFRPPKRRQRWPTATILIATLAPIAILAPAIVESTGIAAASPAAGYTAAYVPSGKESTFVAVNPTTDTAYFGAFNAANLTVIDGTTDAVTTTIGLSSDPRGIAVDPATDTVYVSVLAATTSSQPMVEVIDGATNTVTSTVSLPVGSEPFGLAVDSSTDTLYVAEYGAAAVAVIDGSTNSVTTTVSTDSEPVALAVDETTNVIWVSSGSDDVQSISGASDAVVQTISPGGGDLEGVAVDPATDTVYAATETGGVAVINGATGAITTTIAVTEPLLAVAVDPGSGTVFASSEDGTQLESGGSAGTTWVIDASTNTITDTVERGGVQVAVDTATGSAYEAAEGAVPGNGWVLTPSTANSMSPVITSIASATFSNIGGQSSFPIEGSALPAATYSETGPLPAGATLSPTGTLSLAPTAGTIGGVYPITIVASNGVSPDYSQAFTLTVETLPTIAIEPSATVQVGTPVSIPIDLTGYPPVTNVSADYLPPGLTVTEDGPNNWQLDGTPAAGPGGLYQTELFASNAVGTVGSVDINITVQAPPSITSAPTTTFFANTSNNYKILAIGYPAPTVTVTGSLPPDVQISSSGLLQGDPPTSAAGEYNFTVTASNSQGTTSQAFTLTVEGGSSFVPVSPVRLLDTRNGTGGYDAPVGPGGTISLQVTGVDGVPSSGVTAVVLNVTATDPTASSYVTVYPDGQARPTASNLNFTAGETIPNLVTVPVGSDGEVDFYNNSGGTDLVADLEGYYTTSVSGSLYVAAGPSRVLDTRNGTGAPQAPVGPGGTISLQVTGVGAVPATGVTAVVLNVTATDPTASSYLTVYPDGTTQPTASNLNFTAGETIPNLVVVPVGADGKVDFYNFAGSMNVVADLAGYYTTSGAGASFVPVGPVRLLDTRNGTGGYDAPVGQAQSIGLPITGVDGLPATGVTAVVLNVTATSPTTSSYVTVYPDGTTRPVASNLNFTAGETIPNLVTVPVGADGEIDFYNFAGSTDLVADLAGYFTSP